MAEILRRVADHNRQVCLTFDDGPDPRYTPRVLDKLARADVRATFFLVGMAAARYPRLVRRIHDEGHGIGNHTWSHAHPGLIHAHSARHEVSATNHALADLTGQMPRYFRPPFGHLRGAMLEQAGEQGQTVVLWRLSAVDWGPLGRAAGIVRRLAAVRAGDIVLLHDARRRFNRPWVTLQILDGLLDDLKRHGLHPLALQACDSPLSITASTSPAGASR